MTIRDITRTEAHRRSALLHVHDYEVELDLSRAYDRAAADFTTHTTIRFRAQAGARTFVDLVASRVHGIELNGNALDPAACYTGARILLADLGDDNELRVTADCSYAGPGEGLQRSFDVDGSVHLHTQFEVCAARRVFAVFDQPDLKAPLRLTVTAPNHWEVFSNSPTPSPHPVDASTARWRFPATPPLPSYVMALVAGPFQVHRSQVTLRGRSIPLAVAARPSRLDASDAEEILDVTRRGIEYFSTAFGQDYPFAKHDQIVVPDLVPTAMENAGCVTLSEDLLSRSKAAEALRERRVETVLHELAHMWFGNLVTIKWWDDLWLKEAFATYWAVTARAGTTGRRPAWATFANGKKAAAYQQDELPTARPVSAAVPDTARAATTFDGISYAKGAAVLRQLAASIGPEEFHAGIRRYFTRHRWGNAGLDDFLAAMSHGRTDNLEEWSAQWFETPGHTVLRADFDLDPGLDGDGRYTRFAIRQESGTVPTPLRDHRLAIGCYDMVDGHLVRTGRLETTVTGSRTEIPGMRGRRQPDLLLLNDDDLTYAQGRFDDRSLTTLRQHIGDLPDPLARALCWGTCWNMAYNAEFPAREYVRLALSAIDREPDTGMREPLRLRVAAAVERLVHPDWRPAGRRLLADTAHRLALATDAGSDHQLGWVRTLADTAATGEQLTFLSDLLHGIRTLPELVLDAGLRWTLLRALVVNGHAGAAEIQDELRRDQTRQLQALRTRAAQPAAAAKEATWRRLVGDDELTLPVVTALVGGFQTIPVGRHDLLDGYAARYFDVIGELWDRHPYGVARQIAHGLYPRLLVGRPVLDLTERFLDRPGVAPGLRKIVSNAGETMIRCLNAQATDARSSDTTLPAAMASAAAATV
ncbi:aminopeptidase N [Streptomyces sp. AV19]|uniref:aminopeptidase N n=1 Tax=Streptomyces sp. AV19 TaxID=2793068 RepID=UPI0018FEC31A|nr:aminopeptidase N [Streptomyces sp. AV19]MBH1934153.1 aminopeptidase N [Streptomyces sp. AV19]MDG4533678.1 aminopeptidase N [Streptomyces sp. AV19]